MRSKNRLITRVSILGMMVLGIIFLASCGGGGGGGGSTSGGLVPTDTITSAATSDWTFLVYLNSDNNLEDFGYLDIKEMEKVGSTDKVKIVVQWDRLGSDPSLSWKGCRRYLITTSSEGDNTVRSTMLENLGDVNMGSPDTLVTFVKWGMTTYPARKYALILWDHGSGWRNLIVRDSLMKDISWDETSGDHMTTEEMSQAFRQILADTGTKLEFVGMDACLMASTEIAYELRNCANYVAFSEASEPGAGWPYDTILADLIANPTATGADLGRSVVQRYKEEYASSEDVTQSAIDLSKINELATAVSNFGTYAQTISEPQKLALVNCINASEEVDSQYNDYVDLGSFVNHVNDSSDITDTTLKARATEIKTALTAAVVSQYAAQEFAGCTGLTIWLPNYYKHESYSERYSGLGFSVDTAWNEFLSMITNYYL